MKKFIKSLFVIGAASLILTSCGSKAESSSSSRPNTYNILWKNDDGILLEIDYDVIEGEIPTYNGLTPHKNSDDRYNYVFSGWTPNVVPASANTEYVATYTSELRVFNITWKDEDGTVLEYDEDVLYGTMPEFNSLEPTKQSTTQYNYIFDGWEPEVTEVTGHATYEAKYKEELRSYNITWKDEDGKVLATEEVPYGETPSFKGEEPTKEHTTQYSFSFDSWTPEIKEVTGDASYTATYKATTNKYVVTWKNEDGSVLKSEEVAYGEVPEYDGAEPLKDSTAQYSYTFDGWSPEVISVTGPAEYIATFKAETNSYPVTWKNEDGTILRVDEHVLYGTVPTYEGEEPHKDSTVQHVYSFAGWSPDITEVTGPTEYVATFSEEVRKYTVTWLNDDGSIIKVDENVLYDTVPSYEGDTPTKERGRGVDYTFAGWTPEITAVKGDQTYTATYTSTGTFEFSLIPYQLEYGVEESNLQGAPWVNVNIEGQIDKIQKPSLKDDFYTSINYESIRDGTPGPFDISSDAVRQAIDNVFNGNYVGTNGAIITAMMNRLHDGDVENVSSYLNNLDLEKYLSSKEAFSSTSSLLQLYPVDDGYEVAYNDGYINGEFGLHTLWFYGSYYPSYLEPATNMLNCLSNTYNLGLNSDDIDSIHNFESDTIDSLYYNYYRNSTGKNTYSVDTVPWDYLKSALLDAGLKSSDTIYIKRYANGAISSIFNNVSNESKRDLYTKAVMARAAFDYRILMGFDNYRLFNGYLSQVDMFENERWLANASDYDLAKRLVQACLPILVEQAYLDQEGSPETKAKVAALIEEVLDGYKDMLSSVDWLSETSKNSVIKKLTKMKYESCYPDGYKNFVKLDQKDLGNTSLLNIYSSYFAGILETSVAGQSLNDPIWSYMTTYTVNAFYTAGYNKFVILNGIVSGMVGDTTEELYGMLGTVIGHEITHAFDSSGSRYDENGQYNDMWTSSDRTIFNNKVTKMANFYKNITLYDTAKVDGDNINGEATADMGGVKVMLLLAESIPDFDYDLFFKSYARLWKETPYPNSYLSQRAKDAHPFEYLRANVTLAQFDKFIETYDIQPGDGMYIPEEQRIAIW